MHEVKRVVRLRAQRREHRAAVRGRAVARVAPQDFEPDGAVVRAPPRMINTGGP